MKLERQKTALMRVRFSAGPSARAALEDWRHDWSLSLSILRGRITQDDASFEIAVTGPTRGIQDFMRRGDTWGASIGSSSMGVA